LVGKRKSYSSKFKTLVFTLVIFFISTTFIVYKYVFQNVPKTEWKLRIGDENGFCVVSDIAVTNDAVYVAVDELFGDVYLYAISLNGSIKWKLNLEECLHERFYLKPLNNGILYAIGKFNIAAIDGTQGSVIWCRSDIPIRPRLAKISERTGNLYVCDSSRKEVLKIDPLSGEVLETIFEVPSRRFDSITSVAIAPDEILYILVEKRTNKPPYVADIVLYSVDAKGSIRWRYSFRRNGIINSEEGLREIYLGEHTYGELHILGNEERKYNVCVEESYGAHGGTVICFTPSGKFKWRKDIAGSFYDKKSGNLYLRQYPGLTIVRGYDWKKVASIKIPAEIKYDLLYIIDVVGDTVYGYCISKNLRYKVCALEMKKIKGNLYDLEVKWEFDVKHWLMDLVAETSEVGVTYIAFPYEPIYSTSIYRGSCFLYAVTD